MPPSDLSNPFGPGAPGGNQQFNPYASNIGNYQQGGYNPNMPQNPYGNFGGPNDMGGNNNPYGGNNNPYGGNNNPYGGNGNMVEEMIWDLEVSVISIIITITVWDKVDSEVDSTSINKI